MVLDLSGLNEAQRAAVTCTDGPLLVLAGAGSGKTRVLTYRIAHLVLDKHISPHQILAITFTNKAATEMRERLSGLLGSGARSMLVSTFHAMCVRFLRTDAELLGYTRNFTIYDDSDSRRLLRDIFNELSIDPKEYPLNAVRARISKAKNDLVLAEEFEKCALNTYERLAARVYHVLQGRLLRADAMDFDDLLVNCWLLLSRNPTVLAAYQKRFLFLHIDEYQDTNVAQYSIAQMLARAHRNIMVVGDDDQSIYSWRGAQIRNILDFEKDYPEAQVIKLEQNYRSTARILEAANAVISNNAVRKAKHLFTNGEKGEKLALYQANDERDEGRWIASEVESLRRKGYRYHDCALLYRTNAQSRSLEDMLIRAGIPYRIVGGNRFFDRAEIRDLMAYLRLIVNHADDLAAKRIINVPKRGIGKITVEKIDRLAREKSCNFFEAVELAVSDFIITGKTHESLSQFVELIREAARWFGDLRDIVEMIVTKSGIIEALEMEGSEEAYARIENIREFFSVAMEFEVERLREEDTEDGELEEDEPTYRTSDSLGEAGNDVSLEVGVDTTSMLVRFTEWLSLRSDLDLLVEGDDYLTMMTIHSAKGLEFPIVFIAGMEEFLFPHIASFEEEMGLEEERRLAYVAITRARERLYLTHALSRYIYGTEQDNSRSRFISEIPAECLELKGVGSAGYQGIGWEKRGDRRGVFGSGTSGAQDKSRVFGSGDHGAEARSRAESSMKRDREVVEFTVGDEVDHKTFGRGQITGIEGDALYVRFSRSGETKKLLKGYAPIVRIS